MPPPPFALLPLDPLEPALGWPLSLANHHALEEMFLKKSSIIPAVGKEFPLGKVIDEICAYLWIHFHCAPSLQNCSFEFLWHQIGFFFF